MFRDDNRSKLDLEPCRPCGYSYGEPAEAEHVPANPTPEELAVDGRRTLDRIYAITAEKE